VIADKYRLEAIIGEGANGVVWRAEQLGLERRVAVKVMHPRFARHAEERARFTREARVAATLRHPAAVTVVDFGELDGVLYLVMELLVGQTLRQRLARGLPAVAEVGRIGSAIASALAAAHRIQLVHRDLKPENVFLETSDEGARVRVLDFGLAFILEPRSEDAGLGRLTTDGSVSGTPAYMSPEQVHGRAIGPASDIYALGCMLYELLTGRPPFIGTVPELFTRHAYAAPAPLRVAAADREIDPAVDQLVCRMLEKSPLVRPTLAQIRATLAALGDLQTERMARAHGSSTARDERALPVGTSVSTIGGAPLAGAQLGWIGPWDDELAIQIAASDLLAVRAPDLPIVYAPGIALDRLAALTAGGQVVITDSPTGEIGELIARLRAGAADVVLRPVTADDLARKALRLLRAGA
jgi:serine/threonine-protein kinase